MIHRRVTENTEEEIKQDGQDIQDRKEINRDGGDERDRSEPIVEFHLHPLYSFYPC